jgi:outer membrane protein OmpA-like peptidoglycan-associated protein
VAGNATATVTWVAPASNGGSVITGYKVTSSVGDFTCTATGATTCTVTGLTNGTTYTFTVTATNALGSGTPSSPTNSVTPFTQSTGTTTTTVKSGTTTTTSPLSTTTTSTVPKGGSTTTTTPKSTTTTTTPHTVKIAVVTVDFAIGGSKLNSAAKNDLEHLAKKLRDGDSVTITGYAKGNSTLAKSRAKVVADYLSKLAKVRSVIKTVTTSRANKTTVKMTKV